MPRLIKAIAMQFASNFARPIGYAVSSLVANFFFSLSNPQAACLCLEFWPLHFADTAWNASWLKASIVFFFLTPPYWHEWNILYCICFATAIQNIVAQNRLNCGFYTLGHELNAPVCIVMIGTVPQILEATAWKHENQKGEPNICLITMAM